MDHYVLLAVATILISARLASCVFRLYSKKGRVLTPFRHVGTAAGASKKRVRCLVVLGSGGHTSEMMYAFRRLTLRGYDVTYVHAASDAGSAETARAFEAAERPGLGYTIYSVPRARHVGQSYITSVFTTLWAALFSFWVVVRTRPELVLTNGPGTCVPIAIIAYVARFVCLAPPTVVYIESFTCVSHLSLSGKILRRFADVFAVQWPELHRTVKGSIYVGRIPSDRGTLAPLPRRETTEDSYVLVTVGSTCFDALIEACDADWFVSYVKDVLKVPNIRMQIGAGTYVPRHPGIEYLRYKATGFAEDLASASLVVGHAGAGSILDCMRSHTPMVVVPNESLMNNHQTELCDRLREYSLVHGARVSELERVLPTLDMASLRCFPPDTNMTLKHALEGEDL
eukprot:PhM_4_TR9744/c0_g1_i1/m.68655/K07441/ALG14; beta-1,4-N-acetylglucosaminyltransferase